MNETTTTPADALAFDETRRRLRRDRHSAHPDLDRAFVYLERHLFDAEHTIRRLVRASGLSRQAFYRLFHRELGVCPHLYVTRHRLATAAVLLRASELGIQEIAGRVGYASHQGFLYAFRCWAGETPLRFRVRHVTSVLHHHHNERRSEPCSTTSCTR